MSSGRRSPGGERSAEEREAARLERERRRAAREGRPVPAAEPRSRRATESRPRRAPAPPPVEPPAAAPPADPAPAPRARRVRRVARPANGGAVAPPPAAGIPAPGPAAPPPAPPAPAPPGPGPTPAPGPDPGPPGAPDPAPLPPDPGPPAPGAPDPAPPAPGPAQPEPEIVVHDPWLEEDPAPLEAAYGVPARRGGTDDVPVGTKRAVGAAGAARPGRGGRRAKAPKAPKAPKPAKGPAHGRAARRKVERTAGSTPPDGRRPVVGRPGAAAGGPPRRSRRLLGRALALLALLVVGAVLWFVAQVFQPLHGGPSGDPVAVTIPEGRGAGAIGDLLEERGVIDSSFFFSLRAKLSGAGSDLKPGQYELAQGTSYAEVFDTLSAGPPEPERFTVTVPEGRSIRETAPLIGESALRGDYRRAVRRARFDTRRYGAPSDAPLEGFLFPATYEFEIEDRPAATDLVRQQLAAFRRNIDGVSMRRARRAGLTPYEVLIIASMIERETALDRERPLIASVIYNRLERGEPLGIDATIRYAENNWSRPLRVSELQRPGPYNTRLNQGLPPTPIGNPGLASIRAAANPKRTNFLFYVVKPGTEGHAFSETLAEFEADVARYNREREANGGNAPSTE